MYGWGVWWCRRAGGSGTRVGSVWNCQNDESLKKLTWKTQLRYNAVPYAGVCWQNCYFSVCMSVSVSFLEKLYCSKGVIPAIFLQVSALSGSAVVVRITSKREKNGVHSSAGRQGVGAK